MAEVNGGQQAATGSADPSESGAIAQGEKSFTSADVDRIVKDRLVREQKKFDKQLEELRQSAAKKPSANVEEDLRSRLGQYEAQAKSLTERLSAYRARQLKSEVERECVNHGCNDPELLATHLLSRGVVSLGDDDTLAVDNATNSLAELVRDELTRRPHLVKPSQTSGIGTKAPGVAKSLIPSGKSPKDMSSEEWATFKESQGIKSAGFKLF